MFTGIVECTGRIKEITQEGENINFQIESTISNELKIDQSVTHDGACLTVTKVGDGWHEVTAILETLRKTSLGNWSVDYEVNLERSMQMNGRLDGHIVQGHVDQVAVCSSVKEEDGSWFFTFEHSSESGNVTVEKGSICINGVSLTVVNSRNEGFSVAIIPYTYEHTNFKKLQEGSKVNIEFDILGKYVQRILNAQN